MEPPVKPPADRPLFTSYEYSLSYEVFVHAMYLLVVVVSIVTLFVWSWLTWPRDLALWDTSLGYGPDFYVMFVLGAGALCGLLLAFILHLVGESILVVVRHRAFTGKMKRTGWYDYDKDKAAYIRFKMDEYHASQKK